MDLARLAQNRALRVSYDPLDVRLINARPAAPARRRAVLRQEWSNPQALPHLTTSSRGSLQRGHPNRHTAGRSKPQSCSGRRCESASAISISVANLVHCRAKSMYAALAHGLVAAAANSVQRRERARHSSGSPGMADSPSSGFGRPRLLLDAFPQGNHRKKLYPPRSERDLSQTHAV